MVSIEKSKGGQFYARVTGKNNEKLVRSETLKDKRSVFKNQFALFKELAAVFGFSDILSESWNAAYKAYWKMNVVDNTKKK